MKKLGYILLIAVGALGGFGAGKYQRGVRHKQARAQHVRLLQDALTYTDPYAALSDEELAATCEVNATPCAQLVQKLNQTDLARETQPDQLVGQAPSYGPDVNGSRGYLLADGRTVDYNLEKELVSCDVVPCPLEGPLETLVNEGKDKQVPSTQYGFVTVRYPDGRSLLFNAAGELVNVTQASYKECRLNGYTCNAVAKALNDPRTQNFAHEVLGVAQGSEDCTQLPVLGVAPAGVSYKLADGSVVMHQTGAGGIFPLKDTKGFVLVRTPQNELFMFDPHGHPWPIAADDSFS